VKRATVRIVKHLFRFLTQLFCRDLVHINSKLDTLLMKTSDIAAQLTIVSDNLSEASKELLAKIADLEAALANPDAPQAVADAIEALKTQSRALADVVPNPTEPPAEPPVA